MNQEKYVEDLREIREIMNRSSRFISLSGWSGIAAGSVALIGAYLAYHLLYIRQPYLEYEQIVLDGNILVQLLLIAGGTLVLAVGLGIFFTTREAKLKGQTIWDAQAKRLLINLAIPLVAGGILSLILLSRGSVGVVAPLTLIFYGLALVNASKYTLTEIRSLGIIEIVLGLLAAYWIGFGLLFWAIGFGILHIAYGIHMQLKYRS